MPSPDLSPLFQPLPLAGTELPNRVMTTAMTLQFGEGGLLSDRHLATYEERARGGVGLMFSEQLTASPLSHSPFGSEILAYDERNVERFAALAERLAPYPSRFFAQLFCGGVTASSTAGLEDWGPVRGPSRIGAPGGEMPLPLSVREIEQLIADFVRSARHVREGGLDGVEIHGSHGWLIGQFLSPYYNRREDEYGGSVANRCRLALELGRAIRAAVGPEFPLGIALTYDEMIGAAGITEDDTLAQLEVFLADGVFDYFDLSIGSPHSVHFTIAPMTVEEGFSLDFAGRARALVAGRAAVFAAGRVVEPGMAAAAVRDGAVDVVAMSRAHLADPHLVRKMREGRPQEVRRCIGANVCVGRALVGQPVACVLTPAFGRELGGWPHTDDLSPVGNAEARRVLVVGAGPAGLRAGAIAAARGHSVTVCERRERAGGHLADLAWLPTREPWGTAVADLLAELARAGGELRLGTEVDRELVEREAPDLVLLAAGAGWEDGGATAAVPAGIVTGAAGRLLGLDAALEVARTDPGRLGGSVVVADDTGSYAPLGLAEALAAAGAEVRYLTARDEIATEPAFHLEFGHLLPRLRGFGVALETGRVVSRVDGPEVEVTDLWGGPAELLHGVETVVLALRRRPRDELAKALGGVVPELRTIGDALTPRPTEAAFEEAERVALAI
jgi:2,4-dienoyl-CoA reductase-like NADH-dependent reductase (Old Yellow Enzyme family)